MEENESDVSGLLRVMWTVYVPMAPPALLSPPLDGEKRQPKKRGGHVVGSRYT